MDKLCSVEGCGRLLAANTLCLMHYKRARKYGTTDDSFGRKLLAGKECMASNCARKATYFPGHCQMHHRRFEKWGMIEDEDIREVKVKNYKGRYKYSNGYVYLYWPGHSNAKSGGVVAEHHAVMAEKLGRPLDLSVESVHHKNGVKDDNRPENLELWGRYQPAGQRITDLVDWAREILARYGDEVERGVVV